MRNRIPTGSAMRRWRDKVLSCEQAKEERRGEGKSFMGAPQEDGHCALIVGEVRG